MAIGNNDRSWEPANQDRKFWTKQVFLNNTAVGIYIASTQSLSLSVGVCRLHCRLLLVVDSALIWQAIGSDLQPNATKTTSLINWTQFTGKCKLEFAFAYLRMATMLRYRFVGEHTELSTILLVY